jgi:hypothetical protein
MKKLLNRREFAQRCAGLVAIAAVPVSASTVKLILPKLDPASGLASKLGYTHDVDAIPAQVLLAKHPYYAPGSKCSNCVYFQGGTEWGKCNIFTNNMVNAKGWCGVWAEKPNLPLQLQPTGSSNEFLEFGP